METGHRRAIAVRVLAVLLGVLASLWAPGAVDAGLNTWTTGGPEGGAVAGGDSAPVADPLTPGVVYTITFADGIFKSTTSGDFWTPINHGLPSYNNQHIVVDPKTPGVLYASSSFSGVLKSIDGGATWTLTNAPFGTGGNALAIDPTAPATLYAGTDGGGVLKTIDGGATWTATNLTVPGARVAMLVIDPQVPTTLYAAADHDYGILKSTNAGASFTAMNSGLTNLNFGALAIDPQTPATLYAGTWGGGVFKSTDGAASWHSVNTGLSGVAPSPSHFALFVWGGPGGLTVDPRTPTTVYVGTAGGIFKSINGAASWSALTNGIPRVPEFCCAVSLDPHVSGTLYYATFGGGVFKSTNGGASFNPGNAGLTATAVIALAVHPTNPATLYGGTAVFFGSIGGGVAESANGGASWTQLNNGITDPTVHSVAVDPSIPTTLYAGTSGRPVYFDGGGSGGVFKSIDAGATWSRTSLDTTTPGNPNGVAVPTLVIDPEMTTTLYAGTFGSGVHKSTDAGSTWRPVNTGLSNQTVSALVIDARSPMILYAGTAGGVFKSTNGGTSWSSASQGLTFRGLQGILALALDPRTSSTVYAGTDDGLFKSVDGGATWRLSKSGVNVTAVVVDPGSPSTTYIGTACCGVFRSADGGSSFSAMNGGLSNTNVKALALNGGGACVHAGTEGGVFDLATQGNGDCAQPPRLVSSLLPASRSVQVGGTATAFATVIATGGTGTTGNAISNVSTTASGLTCGITQLTGAPTPFAFQATDPATNQPIGRPNSPVNIPPGSAQSFVISLTPTSGFCPLDIRFGFNCTNTDLASTIVGVNTLLLTASSAPAPDVIALAATLTHDGIVNVPGPDGTGAFAVATINAGASGSITVSADAGGVVLPVSITLCQTDPTTAECLSPPQPTVTTPMDTNATPTFSVFVRGTGAVPFDPATNRIFVRFKENATCPTTSGAVTRGSTSVAVRTQ